MLISIRNRDFDREVHGLRFGVSMPALLPVALWEEPSGTFESTLQLHQKNKNKKTRYDSALLNQAEMEEAGDVHRTL
jgi:hypothetical protein